MFPVILCLTERKILNNCEEKKLICCPAESLCNDCTVRPANLFVDDSLHQFVFCDFEMKLLVSRLVFSDEPNLFAFGNRSVQNFAHLNGTTCCSLQAISTPNLSFFLFHFMSIGIHFITNY